MPYVATINVPGYLPTDDDPPMFETAEEAWSYLADEHVHAEDEAEPAAEEAGTYVLRDVGPFFDAHGNHRTDEGTAYLPTPGRHNDPHDLGLAYCVTYIPGNDDTLTLAED